MREIDESGDIRLDRWLWAARFFKTRGLATDAVTGGKVHLNGARVKPSKDVHVGDELTIRRGPYQWVVLVRGLATRRGPAADALALYEETEQSKQGRERLAEQMRLHAVLQPHPKGRPSKKARRKIIRFTQRGW